MTLLQLYVPDPLVHRYRRAFPHAKIETVLRSVLLDQILEKEKAEEEARWRRFAGRGGERSAAG